MATKYDRYVRSAKRIVTKLGRLPAPTELKELFAKKRKSVTLPMPLARRIHSELRATGGQKVATRPDVGDAATTTQSRPKETRTWGK